MQVQTYIVRYTVPSSTIAQEFEMSNPTPYSLVTHLLKDNAPVGKYPNIRYKVSSSTRLLVYDTPLEQMVNAFAENLIELTLAEGPIADWIQNALNVAKTKPVSCVERVELELCFQDSKLSKDFQRLACSATQLSDLFKKYFQHISMLQADDMSLNTDKSWVKQFFITDCFENILKQHPEFFKDPESVFGKFQLKFVNVPSHVKIGNQTKIDVSVKHNNQEISLLHTKSISVDEIFEEDLEEDRFEILCFFLYFLGRPFPKLQKKTVNQAFEKFESL